MSASKGVRRWWTRKRLLLVSLGAVIGAVVALVGFGVLRDGADPEEVTLAQVQAYAEAGEIAVARVVPSSGRLEFRLGDRVAGIEDDAEPMTHYALYPGAYVADLTTMLLEEGVEVSTHVPGTTAGDVAVRVLSALPMILFVALLGFLVVKAVPDGSFRGARKLQDSDVPDVSFEDVAGADEAVSELRELVDRLRNPKQYAKLGARMPVGMLLVGPPGTGKTLLARAVAGEAQVPFFSVAGSDFNELYMGMGAKRVRKLFAEARKAGPAIVFIDEVDALGRARTGGSGPQNAEHESTLLALLTEMDGFSGSGVVVLAATNRPDVLDPALKRPGRLDREVHVPNPDRKGREKILLVHAAGRPVAADVDFVDIARRTPGMSGAELAQVVDLAALDASRRGLDALDRQAFSEAVAVAAMGRARTSALVTERDRRITAWHEAGHALAALTLPHADDPVVVTIVPRGAAGGVTWMSGNDDQFMTRLQAMDQLVVAMAGRAAEELALGGDYSQGPSGDLSAATDLAMAMVTRYAMSDLGMAHIPSEAIASGGEVSVAVLAAVDELLREALDRARSLLSERRASLESLAEALLDVETLHGEEIAVATSSAPKA